MHWRERLQRTLELWPYMAPLALVYFAEYVLQVWLTHGVSHLVAVRYVCDDALN